MVVSGRGVSNARMRPVGFPYPVRTYEQMPRFPRPAPATPIKDASAVVCQQRR